MVIPVKQLWRKDIGEAVKLCGFIQHLLKSGNKEIADKIGYTFFDWEYETATSVDIFKHFLKNTFSFENYNYDFGLKEVIILRPVEFSIDENLNFDFIVIIEDIRYI